MGKLTTEVILQLTNDHIARFKNMIELSEIHNGYNKEDCEHYLQIWESIKAKNGDWMKMAPFQKKEILEAFEDQYGE